MTTLTNEYLDELIKKKIFKDFKDWDKNDFHFLLSLLNYPNYVNLALIILVNLKNWILYSNGNFFYSIEKIDKILNKFYFNDDIYDKIVKEENNENNENIKININKKKLEDKNDKCHDDFINIDLDNGILNFGDIISCDTFKFFIWILIFFIVIFILNLFSLNNSINYSNKYNKYNKFPYYLEKNNNLDNLFDINDNEYNNINSDNSNKNKNFFMNLLDDKYISHGGLFKNIILKFINTIF